MTATKNQPETDPLALEIGAKIARHVFQTRGNNSEVHLTEEQLAAALTLAAEQAAFRAKKKGQRK